jgi:PhnB protein
MSNVKPVPDHFHTLNVILTCKNAAQAIEWYKKALNAQEVNRSVTPDGKTIMHCELRIGDSSFMLNDEIPDMGCLSPETLKGSPVSIWMYCDNVDQVFASAIKNGAKAKMEVSDQFWGDRFGAFVDPYGHNWSIATRKEDLSPQEKKERSDKFMKEMAGARK